jgi:transposase InsO family protein
MATVYQPVIQQPAAIDLVQNKEDSFHAFESSWKTFYILTELDKRPREYQLAMIKHCVGVESVKVIESNSTYDENSSTVDEVIEMLRTYCIGEQNVIHERYLFNSVIQSDGQLFETFYLELRRKAQRCKFGASEADLIRDRIVLGIQDDSTRRKLISIGSNLTLDETVKICRSQELASKAMRDIATAATTTEVKSIEAINRTKQHTKANRDSKPNLSSLKSCAFCGKSWHPRSQCPASSSRCNTCKKMGHWSVVCRSSGQVKHVHSADTCGNDGDDVLFCDHLSIDSIQNQPEWTATLEVNGTPIKFKLDSGADATVMRSTETMLQQVTLSPTRNRLRGPSNHEIKCVGTFSAVLKHGEHSMEEKIYVIEDQNTNLLSREACQKLSLLTCNVSQVDNTYPDIQNQYPSLFSGLGFVNDYTYDISLREDAQPMCIYTARSVPQPLLPKVKEKLKEMVEMGVISPVKDATEWCSGMVPVPKPDGSVRICVDLTHLNQSVRREIYPTACVDDSLAQLGQSKVFSRLDANAGYHQINLTERSRRLTTFLTPLGRFHFNRLPFGISAAPEIFQRYMNELLSGIEGVIVHMDDILVHAPCQKQHDVILRCVLDRIASSGMTLNRKKCLFSQTSVKFLGHVIDKDGIHPDIDKTKAIVDFPEPQNQSDIRRLNGMLNQLMKFIPNLATLTAPIRQLLREKQEWIWDEPQQQAFTKLKAILTSDKVLAPYDPKLETILSTDACNSGLGAALFQIQTDGTRRPVSFASRSVTEVESRYAVIEKEALAVVWGCERFNQYLHGLTFSVEVDHKPLVTLLNSKNLVDMPARILRFRLRLMKYAPSIVYVPGAKHHIADYLSRTNNSTSPNPGDVTFLDEVEHFNNMALPTHSSVNRIRESQVADPTLQRVIEFCKNGWPAYKSDHPSLTTYFEHQSHLTVNDNLLLYDQRLVIPSALQLEILNLIHEGHQGIVKCRARARGNVWWPGISRDIETVVRQCDECQKVLPVPRETLAPSSLPERPWEKLGMDFFELNNKWYLLIIDYYSRWIEVQETTRTQSALQTVNILDKVFAAHGYPDYVVSDNGPQFASQIFRQYAEQNSFTHITSSPHYPRANGEAERAVGTVKRLLIKTNNLNTALLNYRSTPLDNGYSPAELLMSRRLKTRIPTLPDHLKPALVDQNHIKLNEQEKRAYTAENHDKRHRAKDLPELHPGQQVFIRDQNTNGIILRQVAPRSYTVTNDVNNTVRRNRSALVPLNVSDQSPANTPEKTRTMPSLNIGSRPNRTRKPPPYLVSDYQTNF